MERVLLKMHYMGNIVDVRVEDTDKSLLIDVYNDLFDEAEKGNVPLPKHPSLGYSWKMNHVFVRDDKDLMEMFTRCNRSEVHIWIGLESTPCNALLLARTVRACNKGGKPVDVPATTKVPVITSVPVSVPKLREKLPIQRRTRPPTSLGDSENANDFPPVSEHVPNIPINTNPFNSPSKTQTTLGNVLSTISPRRSPRLSQIVINTAPPSQLSQITPNQTTDTTQVNVVTPSQTTQLTQSKLKIPKTTAKRKGVYIVRTPTERNLGEGSSKRTKRRERVDYDQVSEEDDSDNSYIPSEDDNEEEEGDVSDLEVEDNLITSALQFIDDGYLPFASHSWSVEEGGYYGQVAENGEVYETKEFGGISLRPWMLFMDKEHFKDVLRDYCIQEGFNLVIVKADNKRYTADCANLNCQWRIHASALPDGITWAIKSIRHPEHGCEGIRTNNPMANCAWVAKKLMEDIRANPAISATSVNSLLMERYGLEMVTSTIYKMKDLAMKEINGGHDDSYKLLPRYCEVLKETNPRCTAICSWVQLETPERPLQFKSIFISFQAQTHGLIMGCRSLIGVDGTHLKGNYGGVLLSAVTLDGNCELFPIAVAVVEAENKESWSYFFWHLKNMLKDSGRTNWTIMSDRQKGIEPALDTIWPEAYRRVCARHLSSNFKKEYPGLLMYKLFWGVVDATSQYMFKKALERVVQHGGLGCARWFQDLGDHSLWTKYAFGPSLSSDDNTSNFVESFNSTLGVHRCNPVLSLLEGVRRTTMVRHATRQQIADSWPDEGICPNIVVRIRVLKKESRACTSFNSGRGKFEVRDGHSYLSVNMNDWTCVCGLWQVSGIPCRHAIRAILDANKDPKDFVNDWYSVRVYKKAYGLSINPVPDLEQWPDHDVPTLVPPPMKRAIGRPSRNRRREPGEKRKGKRSVSIRCKKCKCFGHNSKTCKGGYTAKERQQIEGNIRKRKINALIIESASQDTTPLLEASSIMEAGPSKEKDKGKQVEAGTSKGKNRKTKP